MRGVLGLCFVGFLLAGLVLFSHSNSSDRETAAILLHSIALPSVAYAQRGESPGRDPGGPGGSPEREPPPPQPVPRAFQVTLDLLVGDTNYRTSSVKCEDGKACTFQGVNIPRDVCGATTDCILKAQGVCFGSNNSCETMWELSPCGDLSPCSGKQVFSCAGTCMVRVKIDTKIAEVKPPVPADPAPSVAPSPPPAPSSDSIGSPAAPSAPSESSSPPSAQPSSPAGSVTGSGPRTSVVATPPVASKSTETKSSQKSEIPTGAGSGNQPLPAQPQDSAPAATSARPNPVPTVQAQPNAPARPELSEIPSSSRVPEVAPESIVAPSPEAGFRFVVPEQAPVAVAVPGANESSDRSAEIPVLVPFLTGFGPLGGTVTILLLAVALILAFRQLGSGEKPFLSGVNLRGK